MTRLNAFAAFAIATVTAVPIAAQEAVPATIVTGGDTTIVYVFPTSPQSFAPIEGLPSFVMMPGADAPQVATQVIYTTPAPVVRNFLASIDVDCSNFKGTVTISGPDTFGLDRDGDGIGCETEER
ncbi:MAG: excalibur calcium-binding domain-containing protein [Kaiparowitsia implicata GSE-PSE-MK54-09C]|jgi:hypothetical protein|nr:excalibur calcium-binding domain-containing protein [Kaiparowitsia implicata GSE-PSE-MK54-09C]